MISRTGPVSTNLPPYMTAIRSAISTATPTSWVTKNDGHAELALQFAQQQEDLDLDRRVERGGRLVRQQQARIAAECERNHRALAHPARKLVRIGAQPPLGRGDADPFEQVYRAPPGLLAAHALVADDGLGDLRADRIDGVETRPSAPGRSCRPRCRAGRRARVRSCRARSARRSRCAPRAASGGVAAAASGRAA